MTRVLKLCHNHTLSVSMVAALQRESQIAWTEVERLLQRHKPEVQWEDRKRRHHERKYCGLLESIDLSVQHLSPVDRCRYFMLAVLPEDEWVPVELLQHYWNCRDMGDAQKSIERLYSRCLVEIDVSTTDPQHEGLRIKPHDLQLDYLHGAVVSGRLSEVTGKKNDTRGKLQHTVLVYRPVLESVML